MLKILTKIIVIVPLAIIFSLIFTELTLKVYLADFYFRDALFWKAQDNWPKTLESYNRVLKILPRQYCYQYRFAQDLKDGLKFYSNTSSKVKILDLGIKRIESIPKEQRTLRMIALQANMWTEKIHLLNGKDWSQAEKLYQEAAKLSPKMAGIYNDWCQLKIYEENWKEAEYMCKKALSLYPPLDHPLMNEGHRQQVISEQIKVYNKLGQIYQKQKEYDKAIKAWSTLLHLSPFQYHVHKKIADIYYLEGNFKRAIAENLHGFTLNPDDSTWPFAVALLYKKMGNLPKARYFAKVALEISPEDEEIKQFLEKLIGR